jgi:hypothetical protein
MPFATVRIPSLTHRQRGHEHASGPPQWVSAETALDVAHIVPMLAALVLALGIRTEFRHDVWCGTRR